MDFSEEQKKAANRLPFLLGYSSETYRRRSVTKLKA
ncbi:MAG: hypothetical protein JWP58_2358 [Hymenobacter sp.]|nr:hypothetical protein [Hymenobacter sp.]